MNRSAIAVSILFLCASLTAGAAEPSPQPSPQGEGANIGYGFAKFAQQVDDPKQRQDLTAVIALNGKPCGEVVSYQAKADNDFIATCKDGNRYRVYVRDGRVVVEKQ
jgi:hypothetical protein